MFSSHTVNNKSSQSAQKNDIIKLYIVFIFTIPQTAWVVAVGLVALDRWLPALIGYKEKKLFSYMWIQKESNAGHVSVFQPIPGMLAKSPSQTPLMSAHVELLVSLTGLHTEPLSTANKLPASV